MDPLNPGQFFACCGLLELADLEQPGALSSFVLDASRPRAACFTLETAAGLRSVLERLKTAQAEYEEHPKEPVRPAVIPYNGERIVLDWWLDEFRHDTVNLKCWAGQVTTKNLFSELLPLLDVSCSGDEVFERPAMTKAKFGVDPRSAWNALDFGFSPNEHGRDAATFPAVEILAAIGLQGFRPNADRRAGVFYGLWRTHLPAAVARMAFRSPWDGLPHRGYRFSIERRGQSYKYFTFAADSGKESAD
jgi:CRISPR-associated protein Csx14